MRPPHPLHLPFCATYETTGMSSPADSVRPHAGQCDRGLMIDSPTGTLSPTTLKNEARRRAIIKTKMTIILLVKIYIISCQITSIFVAFNIHMFAIIVHEFNMIFNSYYLIIRIGFLHNFYFTFGCMILFGRHLSG